MTVFSPWGACITGTGAAFPSKVLTNYELAPRIDSSHEWILQRTGISERRIADPQHKEEEKNSSLGCTAALEALKAAGKKPLDIDQIIVATCTPDTVVPSAACHLQRRLGAERAWAMDLNAACSGFVFGLATAHQFIQSGQVQTALVVGSDLLSTCTNWQDRSSCILFGDGAGACIIERTVAQSPYRILSTHLGSDGNLAQLFMIPAGGSNQEVTPEQYEAKAHKMQMNGREIFKSAVLTLTEYALQALNAHQLTLSDLDWIVPHQANIRILEAVAKRLGVSMDRFVITLDKHGNTSSATIPTALHQAVKDGRIQPGHLVLLDVFGAGLTYGSVLLRWGKQEPSS